MDYAIGDLVRITRPVHLASPNETLPVGSLGRIAEGEPFLKDTIYVRFEKYNTGVYLYASELQPA